MGRTRRSLAGLAAAVLLVAATPAGGASDGETWEPSAGGWVSGPLRYVTTVPTEAGTAIDAVRHENLLVVTTWRSFSLYDVSSPLAPQLLFVALLPGELLNEEPQTNGEILLLSRDQSPEGSLDIWDISDPVNSHPVASWSPPLREHIWTCVLDCRFAYGSSNGQIVDLSQPEVPVVVGNWMDVAPVERTHAIDEVAPGIVMTGSVPLYVLDARSDPVNPQVLAVAEPQTDGRSAFLIAPESAQPASVGWPRVPRGQPAEGRAATPEAFDRFALVSTETPFSGNCDEHAGGFATFDTRGWEETGAFDPVDDYRITSNGPPSEGSALVNVVGCSAFGLAAHPHYRSDHRVTAVAWMEHGVRLLSVDADGLITEIGGFVPIGGTAAQPVWVDEETLYVIDLQRGIDILRYEP